MSLMDDIGSNQPAINRSFKIGKKARAVGFDWSETNGVFKKVFEEVDELKAAIVSNNKDEIENELGDLFFTLVSLSRHLNVNPENALRGANSKFIKRFRTYLSNSLISYNRGKMMGFINNINKIGWKARAIPH